jgi:TPR repeat protein
MQLISSLVLGSVLIVPVAQPFGQEKSNHLPKEIHNQPKAEGSLRSTREADPKDLLEHGNQYRLGEGVPQDEAKAAELYRQAAESQSAKGEPSMGRLCSKGEA